MTKIRIRTKARSENETKTIVEASGFKIIIDEPEDEGGTNAGANPVEYMLAAFSGCLNVMAHLIAKEMGFSVSNVEIDMAGDLNPAKYLGEATDTRAGYEIIKVTIKADTDADSDTLAKWLKAIEERCPVSDNINNPTPVSITLA